MIKVLLLYLQYVWRSNILLTEKKKIENKKINLRSKNSYKSWTSLILGGSASGTVFLSLEMLDEAFSSVLGKVPGTEIRHVVCTSLARPLNDMSLPPLFAAYCSVIEFVIVLVCFPHQSGIRALWLRGCFFACLNDRDTYEDGILERSKLSLLEWQDEGLSICEEYASFGL